MTAAGDRRPSIAALDLGAATPRRVPIGRRPVADPAVKVCTRCGGDPKPLSAFPRRASARDGHSSWCLACFRVVNRAAHLRRGCQDAGKVASCPSGEPAAPGAVSRTSDAPTPHYGAPRATADPCRVPGCSDPHGGIRTRSGLRLRYWVCLDAPGAPSGGVMVRACHRCCERLHRKRRAEGTGVAELPPAPPEPCVAPGCPDPLGGSCWRPGGRPVRCDGARFGLEGLICKNCYGRLVRLAAEGTPCAVAGCPDPKGGQRHPGGTLVRKSLKRFGMEGKSCVSCYNRLYESAHKAVRVAMTSTVPLVPTSRQQPNPRQRPVDLDRRGLSVAEACRVIRRLWRKGRAWELTGVNGVDDVEGD